MKEKGWQRDRNQRPYVSRHVLLASFSGRRWRISAYDQGERKGRGVKDMIQLRDDQAGQ